MGHGYPMMLKPLIRSALDTDLRISFNTYSHSTLTRNNNNNNSLYNSCHYLFRSFFKAKSSLFSGMEHFKAKGVRGREDQLKNHDRFCLASLKGISCKFFCNEEPMDAIRSFGRYSLTSPLSINTFSQPVFRLWNKRPSSNVFRSFTLKLPFFAHRCPLKLPSFYYRLLL